MSLDAFSLAGKIALITGGGRGIGLGISRAMAEAGARVVITGRTENSLKEAVASLRGGASYMVNDIRDKAGIPGLVSEIEDRVGPIDILVNNAGLHLKKAAQETTDEEFELLLQTNLVSVFALTRECARGMLSRRKGSVLLIGSMAGIFGINKVLAYGVSKSALTGMMNNLLTEYSQFNVRINLIAPGWIESDMFLNAIAGDAERKKKITDRIAMTGFGVPQEIGNAAVFLSSEAARYVTGVLLPVDGGAAVNF